MDVQSYILPILVLVGVGGVCVVAYRMYSSRAGSSLEVDVSPGGGVKTKLSKTGQDDRAVVDDVKAEDSEDAKIAARGEGSSVSKIDLKNSPGLTIEAETTKK